MKRTESRWHHLNSWMQLHLKFTPELPITESIMNSPSCLRQYKLGFYHLTHEILDQGKIFGPTTFHKRDEEARLRTQVQKSEIKMNPKKHRVRQDCHDNRTAMR